ncbi:ATP-binding protein [Roseateles koreensis]|uniref:histidine kinase n=1 Tax=Roseateles koreensis TaxID=2987526 RepID=A0ABT5KV96_9BURK|nr:ATP-binding protein [Roseateles koreensis]MDC8785751.1 ATP-binding protein [Roseateles koreensis]
MNDHPDSNLPPGSAPSIATQGDDSLESAPVSAPEKLAGRRNLLQLIQLRWLAVAGQLATILTTELVLDVRLPIVEMLSVLAALTVFNLASRLRVSLARHAISNAELFAALLVDVAVLSAQLYFSGGIANPFIFLYLLQIAVGAMLLRTGYIWAMVLITCLCFMGLTVWNRPLHLEELSGPGLSVHYFGGLLICFALNAALLVIFIHRIGRNLRLRDSRLADLRQRAAEEEHIVRMGLLASGAAHELGTPLATLSVILGDWSRMGPFAADPELREEIDEMQFQLARCKTIVTGILMSAGESRGEAPGQTMLHAFLGDVVSRWRETRPGHVLHYLLGETPDRAIISDTALRQMLGNVLDNAQEAAPQQPLTLRVSCEGDVLVLRVIDQGPGFAPEILENFGKPYHSTKGRPGSGLGLFLSVNVARTLGGKIEARNLEGAGAEVRITLPLSALSLREEGGEAGVSKSGMKQ